MYCKTTTEIRVRYGETDQMGFVYYGNYALYLEQGRTDWLRKMGFSYKELEAQNILLPVTQFSINYHAPGRYDDVLKVETTLVKIPGVKIQFSYVIYNEENNLIKLFDSLIVNNKIKYIKPSDYLPVIGFQILESIESSRCSKIGDPNGFCAVWCIWWIEQKLNYPDLDSKNLALKLIEIVKIKNIKFKNLIRNYSKNITDLRDNYLKKYDIDINDWINDEYTEEIINDLEKDIIQLV